MYKWVRVCVWWLGGADIKNITTLLLQQYMYEKLEMFFCDFVRL